MNASQVFVIFTITVATIAGTIVHHEANLPNEDPRPQTTMILATTHASEHITLQTTQNNTLQLTCHPPDDAPIDRFLWRTLPNDAPAPLEGYATHWHIERNHTQTIPHDDEARFPHTGEYVLYAVCETWNHWDDAKWIVHIQS